MFNIIFSLFIIILLPLISISQNTTKVQLDSGYVILKSGEKIIVEKVFPNETKVLCKSLDGKKLRFNGEEIYLVHTHMDDILTYLDINRMKNAPDGKGLRTSYYQLGEGKKRVCEVMVKKGDNFIVKKIVKTGDGDAIYYFLITKGQVYRLRKFRKKVDTYQDIFEKLIAAFSGCEAYEKYFDDVKQSDNQFFYPVNYNVLKSLYRTSCFEEL